MADHQCRQKRDRSAAANRFAGPPPEIGEKHMMVRGQVRAAIASPVSTGGRCASAIRLLAVLFVGALATIVGFHTAAFAQGAVKSVHGDWQIRCETPPGAQAEQCALFQSVVAEDRANVGITVLVLKTADQKSRLMRVQVPLGVLLPAGLGLKIDQVDVGRAGYVRCLPRGCYAEVVMDDTLIGKMKTGQTATFFIFQTPEEGIGFPMGLKGFGEGYEKLP
jgi:invasion protein IalB